MSHDLKVLVLVCCGMIAAIFIVKQGVIRHQLRDTLTPKQVLPYSPNIEDRRLWLYFKKGMCVTDGTCP